MISNFLFFPSASNGDPRTPSSLHYIDPTGQFNAYQQVEVSLQITFFTAFSGKKWHKFFPFINEFKCFDRPFMRSETLYNSTIQIVASQHGVLAGSLSTAQYRIASTWMEWATHVRWVDIVPAVFLKRQIRIVFSHSLGLMQNILVWWSPHTYKPFVISPFLLYIVNPLPLPLSLDGVLASPVGHWYIYIYFIYT